MTSIKVYSAKTENLPSYIVSDRESLIRLSEAITRAIETGSGSFGNVDIACVDPNMVAKMPPSHEGDNGAAIFLYEYNKARNVGV